MFFEVIHTTPSNGASLDVELVWEETTRKDNFLEDLRRLRELAIWYREFAEKAGSPTIWDARLRMAENIDQEIAKIERLRT